jgi:quinol monooxygenase YgiN
MSRQQLHVIKKPEISKETPSQFFFIRSPATFSAHVTTQHFDEIFDYISGVSVSKPEIRNEIPPERQCALCNLLN